jgi:hypothetical protein
MITHPFLKASDINARSSQWTAEEWEYTGIVEPGRRREGIDE